MRQLRQTGFMHNRLRMITASFLVKDLHLPWQWGARWFLEQLIDGDIANNQHGWQWCAGSGTDAAPYFRVFNPVMQGQKFDPAGEYVRRWVPELAGVDDPHLKTGHRPPNYPPPIVDHQHERSEALRRYQAIAQVQPTTAGHSSTHPATAATTSDEVGGHDECAANRPGPPQPSSGAGGVVVA